MLSGARLALTAWLAVASPAVRALAAQRPTRLSRADALAAALARAPRLGVARADTLVAFAEILAAGTLENPVLALGYSRDIPRWHASVELPLLAPWLRRTRLGAAAAGRTAAQHRYAFERALAALDVDTTYTRSLAALERSRLSRRTAADADSLRRMAVARREAGDASDLDVELATVNAGQQANLAAADSLAAASALLDLETAMGVAADGVGVVPADSLALPVGDSLVARATGTTLPVAAAEAALHSAELATRAQRRGVLGLPALTVGFDAGDPTGETSGLLPIVGIALPLPLLNRNQGGVALAEAERERARAELALARVESATRIARALRERATALAKVERDRRLVASADRVAAMSLTAYREGASSLPNVLEAQRNAREVLAQYIDDLAAAWNATAALRVATLTPTTSR